MSIYASASGNLSWKVSSFCDGGQCVRVASRGEFVLIGNTNNPEMVSEFTADEWKQFLAGAKLGEFDSIV
jgi:Domain of unknown function (DUF397)